MRCSCVPVHYSCVPIRERGAKPLIDGATVATVLTMEFTTLTEASVVKNSLFMKSMVFSLR